MPEQRYRSNDRDAGADSSKASDTNFVIREGQPGGCANSHNPWFNRLRRRSYVFWLYGCATQNGID